MRFPIELSQFVRLFMAVEKVYFLELLYSIAIDICYQFLQQMTTGKKKSFLVDFRCLGTWEWVGRHFLVSSGCGVLLKFGVWKLPKHYTGRVWTLLPKSSTGKTVFLLDSHIVPFVRAFIVTHR